MPPVGSILLRRRSFLGDVNEFRDACSTMPPFTGDLVKSKDFRTPFGELGWKFSKLLRTDCKTTRGGVRCEGERT